MMMANRAAGRQRDARNRLANALTNRPQKKSALHGAVLGCACDLDGARSYPGVLLPIRTQDVGRFRRKLALIPDRLDRAFGAFQLAARHRHSSNEVNQGKARDFVPVN
jgi:hypothetical protein